MTAFIFLVETFVVPIGAGIFGARLGLGGGVILVPVLTLVLGIDIHYAIGASIVSVIATSSGTGTSRNVKQPLSLVSSAIGVELGLLKKASGS